MRMMVGFLFFLSAFAVAEEAGHISHNCTPLQTGPANVPEQEPAFAEQTRACEVQSNFNLDVAVLVSRHTGTLAHPWSVEPLPDGDLLVTERPGRMRIVSAQGQIGDPLTGIPPVVAEAQGGLLDVALSPDFETDRMLFWSFSERREQGNGTSVARGVLSEDRQSVTDVEVIFRAAPAYDNHMHYGSRLAFGPDEKLYVTLGERSDKRTRSMAQQPGNHYGKIVRINADGSVPDDNPFVNHENARPEIWTLGHRNVQAAAFDGDGKFWVIEHGAQGGDELNHIIRGKNYGWPVVAYGEEYSGEPLPNAKTQRPGYEQPVYYWDPVIAPSGAQFYFGKEFPEWQGNLLVGALKQKELVRLVIKDGRITGEEHLLGDRGQRIRDVKQDRNGVLYIVTDEDNAEIWKVTRRD